MKELDWLIVEMASRRHGAFSRRQAYDLGATRSGCDRRLASGVWVPARYPAVYVLAGWRETWHQRLVSAVLAAPGEPLASHRAAAVLHGLREGAPIELIAPLRKRPMKSARLHGNTSMRAIARR